MICASLNVRGLCSGPKRAAIKCVIESQHVDILLLPETMIEVVSACDIFPED